jgi:8-oxo-dGTP diphosphatase
LSYTTVIADVVVPFEPVISDPESYELSWVPVDSVDTYPLHPGFADSWSSLRAVMTVRPVVVVDVANVMGAVPDGWWRDRAGAASRLLVRLGGLALRGVPAAALDLPEHTWIPQVVAVLEGDARSAEGASGVSVVKASGSGDDAIVAETARLVATGATVTVVTSDRELVERVSRAGATARGARWLLELLEPEAR